MSQTHDASGSRVYSARAVLLAPAVYDAMAREAQLTRDALVIRLAMRELDDGKGRESTAFFDGLRSRLLGMKAGRETGAAD